ncbi:conserved hypothetical protein [Desulfonatronospira thiodismutans ASO3-1]|uniref:BioF2-like acetyltransferase domain-containing protein n=2 Tax=Desulfonatronospira thiodismutans TaxID=488939 RepID=D6SMS5_9BACT|nr:conserved hypothetical protein [Desulfonatronospira thiodismutans ASO3-1]
MLINMLNSCQKRLIYNLAYIPEHLPSYLCPFSDSEPCMDGGLLYYQAKEKISLMACPLPLNTKGPELYSHVNSLVRELKPAELGCISPVPLDVHGYKPVRTEYDLYYCLDLNNILSGPKLRNMLKRASSEVHISVGRDFTRDHLELLRKFIEFKGLDQEKALFFHRIPEYLSHSDTALVIEARTIRDNSLVAYDILETGSRLFAFYLFNITGKKSRDIPGVNDLLLQEAINQARKLDKKYINMGLGINPGIVSFKAKWGAYPFLAYYFQQFQPAFSWKRFFGLKG